MAARPCHLRPLFQTIVARRMVEGFAVDASPIAAEPVTAFSEILLIQLI
jgi:hypothetical protein